MTFSAAQTRIIDILAAGPVQYSATATVRRCRASRRPVCKGLTTYTAKQNGVKVKGWSVAAASKLSAAGVITMEEAMIGLDTFNESELGSSYSRTLTYRLA